MTTPRKIFAVLLMPIFLMGCSLFTAEAGPHMETLSIAYAEPIDNYSPLGFEAKNRRYLVNIYEPLVAFDRSFNFKTALAVSWGRVNDLTWEFRLREDVIFHDGTSFDVEDAVSSLRQAMNSVELGSLLEGITYVEDYEGRLRIHTESPDPLLLNKLTNVFIFPSDSSDLSVPVGTGPFHLSDFEDNTLILSRFDSYWGSIAYFDELRLSYIPSPEDRLNAMLNGEIHVLANVPPQYVDSLEEAGMELLDFPSLEVSFLMLNAEVFTDENLRTAFWHIVGGDIAELLGGGFLQPTSQFAASGIMGFDPNVTEREVDLELALDAVAKAEVPELTLDLPSGLDSFGQLLVEDLAEIEVELNLNILSGPDYEPWILSGQSDLYFFGWKYDLADAADFFDSVLSTSASFNGIGYESEELEELISEAGKSLNVEARRSFLYQMNELLLGEAYVIPLFEAKTLYALSPQILWEPRLDGFILASEIIENVVE